MIYDCGAKQYVRKSKFGGFRYYKKLKPTQNYLKQIQRWISWGVKKDFLVGPEFRIDEFKIKLVKEGV